MPNYWIERALKAGIDPQTIHHLILTSENALPRAVREREKINRRKQKHQRKETETLPVEQNSLEFAVVFSTPPKNRYIECHRVELRDGYYVESWIPPSIGQPTEFDLNVLLATFYLRKKNKKGEYEVTPYQILKVLGCDYSKKAYEQVRNAFTRMTRLSISTNAWFDPEDKTRRYIADFNFYQYVKYDEKKKKYLVRFSEWVEHSLNHKYSKSIEYKTALKLRGMSKILYLVFAKLFGKKAYVELRLDTVLRLVGRLELHRNHKRPGWYVSTYITPAVTRAANAAGYATQYDSTNKVYTFTRQSRKLSTNSKC